MATALAKGLASTGFTAPENIVASDVLPDARKCFEESVGAATVESNVRVFERADIIVLAVKPQQMGEVLAAAKSCLRSEHLIVSIAAGIRIKTIVDALGDRSRVIRVMPNTPCLVGCGASAYSLGGAATQEDGMLVESLLSTVGIAVAVPESLLDAVTGLSGSGPAYVFQVIEALSDGGVLAGLPREIATRLSAQTVLGAARMVLETGEHPGALKDAVASPGGTTIAGLQALEAGGLRATLMNAVQQATLRSRELGKLT
jgi:pyrroline-5-carboxylate reductase